MSDYDEVLASMSDDVLLAECMRAYASYLAIRREERKDLVRTSWDRCMMECLWREGSLDGIWKRAVNLVRRERGLKEVE